MFRFFSQYQLTWRLNRQMAVQPPSSPPRDFRAGFTLVELLVVISIIGLLSSTVLATLNEARAKARDATRIQDLYQIRIALELYYDKYGFYPLAAGGPLGDTYKFSKGSIPAFLWSDLETALSEFISKLPVDPINQTDFAPMFSNGYGYSYAVNMDGSMYDLIAQFETEHPLNCDTKRWVSYVRDPGLVWCDPPPAPNLTGYIYADH